VTRRTAGGRVAVGSTTPPRRGRQGWRPRRDGSTHRPGGPPPSVAGFGIPGYLAGDLGTAGSAAVAAAGLARTAALPDLLAEAALVLELVPDLTTNGVVTALCEESLAAASADAALRARLMAQRSQLAFYGGDRELTDDMSGAALELARTAGDDRSLVAALRARHDAVPGPQRRRERLALAAEMLAAANRTGDARAAMWGRLWRIDALVEDGRLADAADELGPLAAAVERVGGPVSAWHRDRALRCVAQARGHFVEAREAATAAARPGRAAQPAAGAGDRGALAAPGLKAGAANLRKAAHNARQALGSEDASRSKTRAGSYGSYSPWISRSRAASICSAWWASSHSSRHTRCPGGSPPGNDPAQCGDDSSGAAVL
jgi:hypothetical protein